MIEQAFQSINVYFAFAAVVINAVFVVLVLARTSRAEVYLTFLFACLSAIVWNFGIFMTYFMGRGFWFYFALIGSPMMPALLFHFISALSRRSSRSRWIMMAYTLSGMLSVSSFLAIVSPGIKAFVDSIYWNGYFLIALFPFIISGVIMLRRAIREADSSKEKSRLRYILYGTVIGTLLGFTDLIQIFEIPVPKLGHLGSVLYSSVFAVGIVRHRATYDIIAQMKMKLELLSEMASGIAHEVRSPLSSIKGASRLLAAELSPQNSAAAREYLDLICEEIQRLDGILVNFQHLTRPMTIKKEPVSINETIRRTVTLAEVAALPLAITQELDADLPPVHADAALLKQVFLNLIKNASEAGGEQGMLEIRTAVDAGRVRITFSDYGAGIPPDCRTKIFEPFYTTKAAGIGVGLAITQRIVQAHDGRIEARAAATGGAEFAVFLPGGGA